MGRIHLPDRVLDVAVPPGARLTDALSRAGIHLNVKCGSSGICGGCGVDLLEGTFEVDGRETTLRGRPRRALGCHTRILAEPWGIKVPRRSIAEEGEPIAAAGPCRSEAARRPATRRLAVRLGEVPPGGAVGDRERLAEALERGHALGPIHIPLPIVRSLPEFTCDDSPFDAVLSRFGPLWRVLALDRGGPRGLLGVAVDIGTTTVAAALVDLEQGGILRTAAGTNHQFRAGADVATRISRSQAPGGTEELRRLIVEETVNPLVLLLCRRQDVRPERVFRASIAGNTAMGHLFLGVPPGNLGAIPFNAAALRPPPVSAAEAGLRIHPLAPVDLLPGASAYIGGDVVGGVLSSGLLEAEEPCALLDIGTNAEIVLSARGRLLGCATPAGPAFEGGGLACGMRAASGAVERIDLRPDGLQRIRVIGGDSPIGVCGSGYVDFVSQGRRSALLSRAGRFTEEAGRAGRLAAGGGERRWRLSEAAEGETDPVEVREADIAELMKAKAAVYAGLVTLLGHAGLAPRDLRRIFLAGGFAQHLSIESAVGMGMLPEIPLDRFSVVGNGALGGACMGLLDADLRDQLDAIARRIEVVELNRDPRFEDEYIQALLLPHHDPSRFPGTEAEAAVSLLGYKAAD